MLRQALGGPRKKLKSVEATQPQPPSIFFHRRENRAKTVHRHGFSSVGLTSTSLGIGLKPVDRWIGTDGQGEVKNEKFSAADLDRSSHKL
jgi:hypothetical protein